MASVGEGLFEGRVSPVVVTAQAGRVLSALTEALPVSHSQSVLGSHFFFFLKTEDARLWGKAIILELRGDI